MKVLFALLCAIMPIVAMGEGRNDIVPTPQMMTSASDFFTPSTYANLRPFMNNDMKMKLNPGVNIGDMRTNTASGPYMRESRMGNLQSNRRVVARSASNQMPINPAPRINNSPMSAGASVAPMANVARSSVAPNNPNTRRVVARVARNNNAPAPVASVGQTNVFTNRGCMADYARCMDGYCVREDTAYNRCYCSTRLSQIDATYQPTIENLTNQIIVAKSNGEYTDAEMQQYWAETIGAYTDGGAWERLDNALNITWPDMQSRVRGQNAFNTGHEYCIQYLRGCFYMAGNLRDAYRSEISRDCNTYENNLQRVKGALEEILNELQ